MEKDCERVKGWGKEQCERSNGQLNMDIRTLMSNNASPSSKEAQRLVAKHYQLIKLFLSPTTDAYRKMREEYAASLCLFSTVETLYPQLLSFLKKAMKMFNEKYLPKC